MQFSSTALLLASAIVAGNLTLTRRTVVGCRPLVKGIVYDCGKSGDVLEIKRVTMNPAKPQAGWPLEIRIQGALHEEVTFGSHIVVNGKLEGVDRINFDEDLCLEAQNRRLPIRCPVKPPTFDFKYNVMIPFFVPSGHYEVATTAINQNKNQIFDVVVDFDL